MLVDPLLRGHHVDELAQLAAQIALPAQVDVPVQAHRLVLREDEILAHAAVEAIRQGEINDAIDAAERDGRLGPVAGQRLQPRSLAPGQDHRQDILHVDADRHDSALGMEVNHNDYNEAKRSGKEAAAARFRTSAVDIPIFVEQKLGTATIHS